MASIFLTGFPGFLGSVLVERLLKRYPADVPVNCLVQASWRKQAETRAEQIVAGYPPAAGRIHFYEGDITQPDLALGEKYLPLAQDTIEIFHLAAVYDLAVKRPFAMRVNVEGTHNLLVFAERCAGLRRFQYVSTCYVSGRYPGVFFEDDLDKGQAFNNYYEETKYLAEVEVQDCMKAGMPVTIYRPGIVAGDSHTGATQKYDGIYFIMQWLLRQPSGAAVLPMVGEPERYEVNFVPSDFVINAIDTLSSLETSLGKVYQLSDPHPPTVEETVEMLADATGRRVLRVPLPKWLAKGSLQYIGPVQSLMRIEPAAIDYFTQPTHYTSKHTQADLAGSGITCPRLSDYLGVLVDFMRKHPEVSPKAMV